MQAHLLIALGLLLGAIFLLRALDALGGNAPGLWHLYILGGFAFAGALVYKGLRLRQAATGHEYETTD